jgi:hypothetical protein
MREDEEVERGKASSHLVAVHKHSYDASSKALIKPPATERE